MPERPKGHDWKSCVRQKCTGGSNPPLSAINTFLFVSKRCELFFRHAEEMGDFVDDGNFNLLL